MKKISDIRRHNFQKIADKYETQSVLADELEFSSAYVSHLITGHRNIGEKTARKIETKLKLHYLALDDIYITEETLGNNENYSNKIQETIIQTEPNLHKSSTITRDQPPVIKKAAWKSLPPETRSLVESFVEKLNKD
jgi:plasmid maintenance system antidote protein VapI